MDLYMPQLNLHSLLFMIEPSFVLDLRRQFFPLKSGSKSMDGKSFLLKSPHTTVILKLSRSQISVLNSNNTKPVFQVVTVRLRRCTCIDRGLKPDKETRQCFPVGARNRLIRPLPAGLVGNAFCKKEVSLKVKELMSNVQDFGAKKIREETATDEHMRSLADMLEVSMQRAMSVPPVMDFSVVSWLRMPVRDVDFGWGEPVSVRRANIPAFLYPWKRRTGRDS